MCNSLLETTIQEVRRQSRTTAVIPVSRWCLVSAFLAIQVFVAGNYVRVGLEQIRSKMAPEGTAATFGFPMPSANRFKTHLFQQRWEVSAQRSFLLPEQVLASTYTDMGVVLARLSLLPFHAYQDGCPLLGQFRFLEQDQRICGTPSLYHRSNREKLRRRATFYNDLCATHPLVRFYVFPILSVADWYVIAEVRPMYTPTHFAGEKYVQEFQALLDSSIGYAWAGKGYSGTEVISWYYRTDHHWNFAGAYKAYGQIWELLHAQNPQIGAPLQPQKWIELPDIDFYGSYARRAGYFDQVHDTMIDAVFDIPQQNVHVHGVEHTPRNKKREYEDKDYSPPKFTDHYGRYFGPNYGLIEYTGQAPSGNLLVIADSYSNSIEPLLASHFQHSFFVDLRCYDSDVGSHFVIDDFITRHQITDVLFLGGQGRIVGLSPWEEIQ